MKTLMRSSVAASLLTCLLGLCLLAGCGKKDSSTSDDDSFGGNSSGSSSGDTSVVANLVTDDFNAAIVIRPQRLANANVLSSIPQEDRQELLAGSMGRGFPLDPKKVDAAIMLIGVGDRKRTKYDYDKETMKESREEVVETEPLGCGILRSLEKIDREAVLKKLYRGKHKVVKVEGGEYYVEDDPKYPSREGTYFADEKTLVSTDIATLEKMLAGKHKSSALAALISAAPSNKPIVAVGRGDEALNERLDALMKSAPPRRAAELAPFVPFIKTARTFKLEADPDAAELVKGTAEMIDEKSANDLVAALNLILGQGKEAFQKEKAGMMRGAPPEVAEILPTVIEQLFAGIKVEARGSTVSIAAAAPADLSKLAQAMGPTIKQKLEREREMKRSNNLRMIGMAIRHSQLAQGNFPSNYRDAAGKPLLSWRVAILPYIEQKTLFDQFKLDEPWDSPHNIKLLDRMPADLRSAGDPDDSTKTRFQVAVGPGTPYEKGEKFDDRIILDGSSKTVLIAEVGADKAVPWTKPEDIAFDPADPWKGVGNVGADGLPAVFFDGRTVVIPRDTKGDILKLLFQHADGQPVPDIVEKSKSDGREHK